MMPNYLFSFHGGNEPETPDQGEAHLVKFGDWVAGLGEAVINPGTPLGTSMTVSSDFVVEGSGLNAMAGFSVVHAEDMAGALAMARTCPHLEIDGTIVVSEMLES